MLFSALTLAVAITPTQAYVCDFAPTTRAVRNNLLNDLTTYVSNQQANITAQASAFNVSAYAWKSRFCNPALNSTQRYNQVQQHLNGMLTAKNNLWSINQDIKEKLDAILTKDSRVLILDRVLTMRLSAASLDIWDAAPRNNSVWVRTIADPDCDDANNTPYAYTKAAKIIRKQQTLQSLLGEKNDIWFGFYNLTECLTGTCAVPWF